MQKGANGAINRELGVLTRMFRLAVENRRMTRVSVVRKLKEAAPRHGSFEREQFEAIRKHLPVDLRAVVTVAYTFGWRTQSEVLTLKRSQLEGHRASDALGLRPLPHRQPCGPEGSQPQAGPERTLTRRRLHLWRQSRGSLQKLSRKSLIEWWRREDSNLRHGAYETPALPPELRRRSRGRSRKVTGLRSGSQADRRALRGHCARKYACDSRRGR